DEPLFGKPWLHHGVATRAVADGMNIRTLLSNDTALLAQGCHQSWASLEAIHPFERAMRGDVSTLVEDDHRRQDVTQAYLEAIGIVCRGDLDGTGSESRIDVVVSDDGNHAPGKRKLALIADEPLVTIVVGMNPNRRVAEHRLDACRRND